MKNVISLLVDLYGHKSTGECNSLCQCYVGLYVWVCSVTRHMRFIFSSSHLPLIENAFAIEQNEGALMYAIFKLCYTRTCVL